jgi:ribosomal protein L35
MKLKTKSSIKKRFKRSASNFNNIQIKHSNNQHRFFHKTSLQKQRNRTKLWVSKFDKKHFKNLLF